MKATPEYVEKQIYPPEDYRGEETQSSAYGPLELWLNARKIRYVASDRAVIYSLMMGHGISATVNTPLVEIVPACGNRQRLRATILPRFNNLFLFAEKDTPIVPTVGAQINTARGFQLNAGVTFVYTCKAPLYAIPRTDNFVEVSVLIEQIETTESECRGFPPDSPGSPIPALWDDGTPVIPVLSDYFECGQQSITIDATGGRPLKIIEPSPNGLRRKITLHHTQSQAVWLTEPELQTNSFGGTTNVPNGLQYSASNGIGFTLYSGCGIWVWHSSPTLMHINYFIEHYEAAPGVPLT